MKLVNKESMQEVLRSRKVQGFIVFISCFFMQAIYYFKRNNISINRDRMGDLATPSYLAGLDWTDLISQSNYYGYGMKWLLFPFFKITSNPVTIYFAVALAYAIIISLVYALFYERVSGEFQNKYVKAGLFILLPVVSCIYPTHPFSSEPTLYLSMAILMLVIYNLSNTIGSPKKNALNFFLAFWLCYMLSLHERCLVVVVAFLLTLLFDRCISKRWFVNLKFFIPSFIFNYVLKKVITSHIIDFFWNNNADLSNTTAVPKFFPYWIFQSLDGALLFLGCEFSNLFCIFSKTFGIGILSVLIILKIFYCLFKGRIDTLDYEKNRVWFVLFMVSAISILFTIGGLGLKCRGVIVLNDPYSYKTYTYVRYYFSWVPMLMISTWVLYNTLFKNTIHYCFMVVIIGLYGIIAKWFYAVMLPVLEKANKASINVETGNNFRFYLAGIFSNTNIFRSNEFRQNFLYSFVFSEIVLLIILLLKNKKKLLGVLLAFLIMLYNQTSGFNITFPEFYSSQDVFCQCINYIETDVSISKDVYCPEGVPTALFTLQYMLNKYSVHNSYPINVNDKTIVITWSDSEDYESWLKENNYTSVQLEKGKFIWTRDEEILDKINEFMEFYDA